jgi:hypothetical protein
MGLSPKLAAASNGEERDCRVKLAVTENPIGASVSPRTSAPGFCGVNCLLLLGLRLRGHMPRDQLRGNCVGPLVVAA